MKPVQYQPSFFEQAVVSRESSIIKAWDLGEKGKLVLSQHSQGVEMALHHAGKVRQIEADLIKGIPAQLFSNPSALKAFVDQTYIKLSPLSDGSLKAYVKPSMKGGGNILTDPDKLWPGGVVYYQIDDRDFSAGDNRRQDILDAIKHWEDETHFQFREGKSADGSYILFTEHEKSCLSKVGKQGGKQVIRCDLDGGGFGYGSLLHEIGHAVGMFHEHNRPDQDKHLTIQWRNIKSEGKDQFRITDVKQPSDIQYDSKSIMHYGRKAFSKNRRETITPHNPDVQIGQREALSGGDIFAANRLVELSKASQPHASSSPLPAAASPASIGFGSPVSSSPRRKQTRAGSKPKRKDKRRALRPSRRGRDSDYQRLPSGDGNSQQGSSCCGCTIL